LKNIVFKKGGSKWEKIEFEKKEKIQCPLIDVIHHQKILFSHTLLLSIVVKHFFKK